MRLIILLLAIGLILSACVSEPVENPIAVIPSNTPPPTFTHTPIPTSKPTRTPTPTSTTTPSVTTTSTPFPHAGMPITEDNMEFVREAEIWYTEGIWSMAISHDGKIIATGSSAYINFIDIETGLITHTAMLPTETRTTEALAFSPDGSLLAGVIFSANERLQSRSEIHVWQSSDATLLHVFHPPNVDLTYDQIKFTPDNKNLIAKSELGLHTWRLSDGRLIRAENRYAWGICIQPETSNILLPSGEGAILWDINTSAKLKTIEHPDPSRSFKECEFSPDGRYLALTDIDAYSGGPEPQTKLLMWDLEKDQLLYIVDIRNSKSKNVYPHLSFSPDGNLLLTSFWEIGDHDLPAKIWRVKDGELLLTLTPADNAFFTPDGKKILTSRWGMVTWWRPELPGLVPSKHFLELVRSQLFLLENVDLLPLIKPRGWNPLHFIERGDGKLTVTNDHDNSWVSPLPFPIVPTASGFTLEINMSGQRLSFWGRQGYFANQYEYHEWWQNQNVVHIEQSILSKEILLVFYDGLSSNPYVVTLPSAVQTGKTFFLRFLDSQGKQLEVLDERQNIVLRLDITGLKQIHLPDGIFPEKRFVAGTFVGPNEQLTLNHLSIKYDKGP